MRFGLGLAAVVASLVVGCSTSNSGGGGQPTDGGAPETAPADTDSGGTDASTGGTVTPITIPAGMNVGTVKVESTLPHLTPGDYTVTSVGIAPQRNDDELFANFHGTNGATGGLDLRFAGLNRIGTFKCGDKAKPNDDYAAVTALEFWVSDTTTAPNLTQYRGSSPNGSCTVTVTAISKTLVEGRYSGELAAGTDKITISGEFRGVPK